MALDLSIQDLSAFGMHFGVHIKNVYKIMIDDAYYLWV